MNDPHDPFWTELRARVRRAEEATAPVLAEAERKMAEADDQAMSAGQVEAIVARATGGNVVAMPPRGARLRRVATWAAAAVVVMGVPLGLAFLGKMADRVADPKASPTKAFDDDRCWAILLAKNEQLVAEIRASHPNASETELMNRALNDQLNASGRVYRRVIASIETLRAMRPSKQIETRVQEGIVELREALDTARLPATLTQPESLTVLLDHLQSRAWSPSAQQKIVERTVDAARTSIYGLRRTSTQAADPVLRDQLNIFLNGIRAQLSK